MEKDEGKKSVLLQDSLFCLFCPTYLMASDRSEMQVFTLHFYNDIYINEKSPMRA